MTRSVGDSVRGFVTNSSGATAVEYGILASAIAVAIIVSVGIIGGQIGTVFDTTATKISEEGPSGEPDESKKPKKPKKPKPDQNPSS